MPEQYNARILIVDDEEVTRQLLCEYLSDLNYKVEIASNGEEALQVARTQTFDLIITDIRMTGMSGIQFIQTIREIGIMTAFIVITGYTSREDAIVAMQEGAYAYINKPFILDELKILVERAIEREALLAEAKKTEYYRELSILDGLTRVYNHRYFHEILTREVERVMRYSETFSLLMIDIDNFKSFNDTHGHLAGDVALKTICQVIAGSLRKVDCFCRYGGEEFTVIMPRTPKDVAKIAAERVSELVSNKEIK